MSKSDRSGSAKQIETEAVRKTGRATPDPDKSAQEKFDEMGEREEIQRRAGRDHEK